MFLDIADLVCHEAVTPVQPDGIEPSYGADAERTRCFPSATALGRFDRDFSDLHRQV